MTPLTTEIRTMLEKAAKLIGLRLGSWNGSHYTVLNDKDSPVKFWNPATSAHDSRMLAIQVGIDIEHFNTYVNAEVLIGAFASVDYPPNPTTADKLQCELLAVLKCAAAIYDERNKDGN